MNQKIDPLLSVSPTVFKTGIAYARVLVDADPTINLNRYLRIIHWHGLSNKRGHSRCNFHRAVREWRSQNSYPKRPAGKKGSSMPANWLPPGPEGVLEAPMDPFELRDEALDAEWQHANTGEGAGAALAELVWEWMAANNYEVAAFWDDGEVSARKKEPRARQYRLVVEGEEA